METYVTVAFWVGVAALLIRTTDMATSKWPKEREPKTLGDMVAETFISLAFTIWAGIVLWVA